MVRSILILALATFSVAVAFSQKKVVPVSKSAYTGISLPAGTMEDKRLLVTASAAVLLEEESKKYNAKIATAEVFQLLPKEKSGFSAESLKDALHQAGWTVIPVESTTAYGWLQKNERYLMYYFAGHAKGFDLYFGEPDRSPEFKGSTGQYIQQGNSTITNTVTLPPIQQNDPPAKPPVENQPLPAGNSNYTFTSINWDDGWVSTIETDKVVVTKGIIRVHLYFPLTYDDASRHAGRDYYWDNYLNREFRILAKQYRDHGEMISSFQPPYIEGTAVDPKTGRNCFIAFYVTSSNGIMFPVVAVAPDEQTIRQAFPKAENQYESDLAAMDRYNRFAVALPDLLGKWTGGGSAAMNYYNAYSGAYAGMGAVAMSDKFEFNADRTYSSKHQGASGMVGSMNTYSQSYTGKATVTNWEIVLTNRFDNKTETFHAWFEAVHGGRVLHLQNKQYSSSRYNLVKEESK